VQNQLLILGTATTASLPDPLYVYCTKILFAVESNKTRTAATVSPGLSEMDQEKLDRFSPKPTPCNSAPTDLGYPNTTNQPFRVGNADFDFPVARNITIKSGFFSQTKHPVVFVRPTHPLAPIEHL